jgi:hypothetical protein
MNPFVRKATAPLTTSGTGTAGTPFDRARCAQFPRRV